MIKIVAFALLSGVFFIAFSSAKLTGDHICHRQENYTEAINATTSEPVQVRKNFWCIEKIRCSELQPELKEIVHAENVTKTRTIFFCCPDYEESEMYGKKFCSPICAEKCINGYCDKPGSCECDIGFIGATCDQRCPANRFGKMCIKYCKCGEGKCHPQTGECLRDDEKVELSTSTSKSTKKSDPKAPTSTEHNPYANYKGEYGKEFDHYFKMGLNESGVQESIDKIMDMEFKKANEEFRYHEVQDIDGIIYFETSGNEIPEIETLKHPQFVSDHHTVAHHEETIAMVTVGCLILGMLIFLLAMVYIRRITRRVPSSRNVDPEADVQKPQLFDIKTNNFTHLPLPIPPLRPSLRKQKSVSFDESVDEVDLMNRKRAKSLTDTYDIPRTTGSIIDLYAQQPKSTPHDAAIYTLVQKKPFNTFPSRKNVVRKQSLEQIYDEIPLDLDRPAGGKPKSDKIDSQHKTEKIYENHDSIEKTKL